jgi:hypothetical protein
MNCLGEKLLFTTVRLEQKFGEKAGVGTGFFYFSNDRLFLVTNKHVVDGVTDGNFLMLKGEEKDNQWKPLIGKGIELCFSEDDFIGHPDPKIDIAVANATPAINALKKNGIEPFWMHITKDLIPTEEETEQFFNPAEEVYFVGYPKGIWDNINILPIIRKGITATPYYIDFMGEKKFLIDASVFPGSSGSPVFIYNNASYSDKYGNIINSPRIRFLGVISKTYLHHECIDDNTVATQMIDLGIVYKSVTVQENIEYYLKMINR